MNRISIDDAGWREFVRGRADAGPFHDPAWASLLSECYDMPGFVLVSLDQSGAITAGIPLLAAPRFPGRPRRLVSLPFTDALDPLVDAADAESFSASADVFRTELGVARIELRGPLGGARPAPASAVTHTLALSADPDELARGFSKMRRRNVRLSEQNGLTIRRAQSERDITEAFYGLHLETRRRLGVPAQPKRFFRLLWERIIEGGRGFALIVQRGPVPVASAVFLVGNGITVYKYGASDVRYLDQKPNDLLMSSAIRDACQEGCSSFDFGRSDLSAAGLRAFKSSWGAEEEPLVYSTIGAGDQDDVSSAAGLMGGVLRHTPSWVTRAVGELLYRYAA